MVPRDEAAFYIGVYPEDIATDYVLLYDDCYHIEMQSKFEYHLCIERWCYESDNLYLLESRLWDWLKFELQLTKDEMIADLTERLLKEIWYLPDENQLSITHLFNQLKKSYEYFIDRQN